MSTIREIARLAGISRGTVDRVINKRGRVHPETEKKIQNIIHKMDFQRNSHARALSMQKKKFSIAYIYHISEINPFFDDIVAGINAKVSELHHYSVRLGIRPVKLNDTELFLQALNETQEKKVDGIIMTPFKAPEITKKINELVDKGFPVVTCNIDNADSKRIAFAGCNLYKSGFTAGGLMGISVGGQAQIGIITSCIHYERLRGFKDAIAKNYPDIHIVDTAEAEEDNDKTLYQTKIMMEKNPFIQAIYAETVAVPGICQALMDLGVYKKVKVICFDDMPIIRNLMMEGYISAVVIQNPFWQGYRSFEMLWDYILNRRLPEDIINYSNTEILIRESLE